MTAPAEQAPLLPVQPVVGYAPIHVGLRYLLKKKLSYLAIAGVAISVGVIIVVMSVFTGFHRQFTAVIRGYLSDMTVRPSGGGMHAMDDWRVWREMVLDVAHVRGVAPYVEGAGLLRNASTGKMVHVLFRGVHSRLEGTATELPRYMVTGTLEDLDRLHADPDGGEMRSCFVGKEFLGRVPADLESEAIELVLATATPDLRLRLGRYRVTGIFATGNAEYDSRYVLLGLDAATALVDSGGGVTGLSVRLDDYKSADAARQAIRALLHPGAVLRTFPAPPNGAEVATLALSGDGSRVAALAGGAVRVWDVREGKEVADPIRAGGPTATAVALDAQGDKLLVGRADGSATGALLRGEGASFTGEAGRGPVTGACFSPYGYLAAISRADGTVEVIDMEDGEPLAVLEAREGGVSAMAFDASGEKLFTVGTEPVVSVWDAEEGALSATLPVPRRARLAAVAGSPDGKLVAAGDEDGYLTVWRLDGRGPPAHWDSHRGRVRALRFGWTSEVLVSVGATDIATWGVRLAGEMPLVWQRSQASMGPGALRPAALRADGTRVATVGPGGTVRVHYSGAPFDISTWEEERQVFLEAVQMERFLQGLITSLILVLAEFSIFAIITTMVYEKRRDIGILKAIGFTRRQVCATFLTSGLAIGVVGAGLGVLGGILFADNINAIREGFRALTKWDPFPPNVYYFTEIPAHVGLITPLATAAGAVVCSLLFSIFPALRAARTDPVQTLHYE
jgi:ABC-type lipoprotein release transport system permease subunit